ncbi:MAG: thiamine diphosphokinase [Actinomycetota bacterium]
MVRTAIVVCAGGPVRATPPMFNPDALVIAADAGVHEAERLGLRVDLLVGDLDSADPSAVARVEASGGRVERHSPDKDASDLELALVAAAVAGARRVLVLGGDGGRFDHVLGNAFLMASPRFAELRIDAVLGAALIYVVRDERALDGIPEELVSLFAVGGPARGVTTDGLRWRLDGEELMPGSTRGLSNEFIGTAANVRVGEGVVLVVRPGAAG